VLGQFCMTGIETGAGGSQARYGGGGKTTISDSCPHPPGRGIWDDAAEVADRSDSGSANEERVPAPEAAGPTRKPPAEAVAEARVRAPTRGNRKLEAFLDAVNSDDQVRAWWYMTQVHAERLGMSDHSWVHMQIVLNVSLRLLRLLAKADVEPAMVADHGMGQRDAEVVVAAGSLLHDVGMSIHRADHEAYSLFLAREALERLLDPIYKEPERSIVIAEALHAIIGHRRRGEPYTLEAGVVRVADGLDLAQGRSRLPIEAGQEGIHSISAAAIDEVRISAGEQRPVRVEIEMNNSAGIFQVDDLLATKLRGTPLEERVEIVAEVKGESEKRLLSGFSLP
jgi:metal-dependent HD superfamily phosphatase/phosphodiesterase